MALLRSALLKAAESRWLADNLPRLGFSKRAVRRFMPGEALQDALSECARLARRGTGSVITRLGENVSSRAEADEAARHYLDALNDIDRQALPTHLSVKLTQLGLDLSADHAAAHALQISKHSTQLNATVWIDMESSVYVDRTIDIFRGVRARQENIGLCVQAYLHRTTHDVEKLLRETTAIRLVKGAYKEPAAVALQKKRDVDDNYLRCAGLLLEGAKRRIVGNPPAFATHDPKIVDQIRSLAQSMGVPTEHFEFQMLYGINPQLQERLVKDGYRLRVLISYGTAWFAWYMRRLAEKPANIWFVVRSVARSD